MTVAFKEKENKKNENMPVINEEIKALQIQVIGKDGENFGVLLRKDALKLAHEAELDLVLVSDTGSEGAAVAKIMDFGKILYEKKKKQSEAKKNQKVIQVKEIKLRPKIGEHDLQTKVKQGVEFLTEGKHLKVTLMFRGREAYSKEEFGKALFDRLEKAFDKSGILDKLVRDKDAKVGNFWSRIYYLKSGK